jgi:uncharacterized protein YbjT (DUF2867 family)
MDLRLLTMARLTAPALDGPMTTTDTTTTTTRPVLVTAGTGKTGRRVAERLARLGVPHRVASRRGQPPFDWDDESTWPAALDGTGAAYVAYVPDLAVPGARETVRRFTAAALERGVTRLVLLSGRGEPLARAAEDDLRASGAAWTIVRSAWFAQNFSEHFLHDQVVEGAIALPAGDVPEPFVDAWDVADVAVAALTDDRHVGEVYEVTGPRLLTFADAAASLARALGRPVTYVPVTREEYVAGARAAGLPPAEVEALADLFATVLDGRNASLADGVQRALGRPPRDFDEFAREAAAAGAWDVGAATPAAP